MQLIKCTPSSLLRNRYETHGAHIIHSIFLLHLFLLLVACRPRSVCTVNYFTDAIFPDSGYNNQITLHDSTLACKYFILCNVFGILSYYNTDPEYDFQQLDEMLSRSIEEARYTDNRGFNQQIVAMFQNAHCQRIDRLKSQDSSAYSVLCNLWVYNTSLLSENTRKVILSYLVAAEKNPTVTNSNVLINNIGKISYSIPTHYKDSSFPISSVRLEAFFHYWNFIKYTYPYSKLISKSWDSVFIEYSDRFLNNKNTLDYKQTIMELTASLNDSHSVVSASVIESLFGKYVSNFRVKRIDDKFVIARKRVDIQPNSYIKLGDIVLEVDGASIKTINDSLSIYGSGSNSYSRQRSINDLIFTSPTIIHNLKIERGGKILSIAESYVPYDSLFEVENEIRQSAAFRWMPNKIGYLDPGNIEDGDELLDNLFESSGLIIDLRKYPTTDAYFFLTDHLIEGTPNFFILFYADPRRPGRFRYKSCNRPLNDIARKMVYNKPIALLIDEDTESFGEFLAMALMLNKKATTIGSQSGGANGNVTTFCFPGNIEVAFSGLGICNLDLSKTQITGVKVKIAARNTIVDIQRGKDVLIDSAMNYIKANQ